MSRAVTKRRQEVSLGKMLTTRVRRRISRLRRSKPLEVRSRRRWLSGKVKTVKPSGMAVSSQSASFEADFSYLATVSAKSVLGFGLGTGREDGSDISRDLSLLVFAVVT